MAETTDLAPVWGRAALPLPSVGTLTSEQVRGAHCLWCAARLMAETAVDLGERRIRILDSHVTAFPRGCRPCTARAAQRALANHTPFCEQCRNGEDSQCQTCLALMRLIREAVSRPWTPADIAFQRWCCHVIKCRVCLADDSRCERGKRLQEVWREARRRGRAEAGR
jgi:hypothetical protein